MSAKTNIFGYARLPTDNIENTQLQHITHADTNLLFNGLVTNTADLVDMFKLATEVQQSDTLCLKAGLLAHGTDFLRHVRGMFAYAFITPTSVMLARDTIGIKPLYYTHGGDDFAFASELKALVHLGKPVHEVLPGQIIVFNRVSRKVTSRSYRYSSYKRYRSDDLAQCLHEAVVGPTKRYLAQSDKNVALLLSGGVDSSVIAGMLARSLTTQEKRRITAFCVGNDNTPDVAIARRFARTLQLKLVHVLPHTPQQALQKLSEIVYNTESPHARVIKVALLYDALSIAIKQHDIDVVIGGEGADEVFFGYHRFIDGFSHRQSEMLFRQFFRTVFPATLLQRFDRIMARQKIEGRVPFLDQELIEITDNVPPSAKVHHFKGGHTSKLPLRKLAKQLGLPSYVYERPKIKMTTGATGKPNDSTTDGYLEQDVLEATDLRFDELVRTLYKLFYGNALVNTSDTSEKELEQLAKGFKKTLNNKVRSIQ